MSSPRVPKSCLTECLRQGSSAIKGQQFVNRVEPPSLKVVPNSAVTSKCVSEQARSFGLDNCLGGSVYEKHPSVRGVNWMENTRSGGCDIISQLPFSPPARPGNPLPKNDVFGTSEHRRYALEVIQQTRNRCEPNYAIFGFGVSEEEQVKTNV